MKIVLNDAYVEVDDNDISEHCDKVTIHVESDKVEVTGFGSRNKEKLKGLGDATINVEVFNDFDSTDADLDALLWDLANTETPFEVKIRPTSDAVSVNNPQYYMLSLLFSHNPIDGGVGDAAKSPLEFENASPDGLQRDTGSS